MSSMGPFLAAWVLIVLSLPTSATGQRAERFQTRDQPVVVAGIRQLANGSEVPFVRCTGATQAALRRCAREIPAMEAANFSCISVEAGMDCQARSVVLAADVSDRFKVCGDGCPPGSVSVALHSSDFSCGSRGTNSSSPSVTCLRFEELDSFSACGLCPSGFRTERQFASSVCQPRGGAIGPTPINASQCARL